MNKLILKTNESMGMSLVELWIYKGKPQNSSAFNRNSQLEKWLSDKRQITPNSRHGCGLCTWILKWAESFSLSAWKFCMVMVSTRAQPPLTRCYKRYFNRVPCAALPFSPYLGGCCWSWDSEFDWNETFHGKVLEAAWVVTEVPVLKVLQWMDKPIVFPWSHVLSLSRSLWMASRP